MRIPRPSRTFLVLLLAALVGPVAGCKGEATADAPGNGEAAVDTEAAVGAEALIEEHDGGSVAWNIGADGNVKAAVSGPDGKLVRENVNGTLVWKAGAEATTVPLAVDAKTGLLIGAGPKLQGDLTEINYTLTVDSKPWTGTLHLPAGGTAELVAAAKASVDVDVEGKLGPHGGVIQVVGKDRFEIVADELSGEVRVYLLDADFKAVAMGDRKVTLGVVAEVPQILVLTAVEGGAYCKGKWGLKVDPLKLTLSVRTGAAASAALVGLRAGARIAVGVSAPRVKVRVKTKWSADVDADADVNVHASAKARAKAKAELEGPSVSVKVQAPKVEPPKVSAKGRASAGVKFP